MKITDEQIKELKQLLWILDSKHNVSIPDTQENINYIAEEIVKLFSIPVVIERFSLMQIVEWGGMKYWVIEDNGGDKVLVANSDKTTHPEYNDWWVNRVELNAL
jgi:hypothetical protein